MNYQKIYDKIILSAKQKNRDKNRNNTECYETHHIIPKCLGGTNDDDNLVLLTLREHFLCHKLLAYIHPKNLSIICAYKFMSSLTFKYNISSKEYEYAKKLYRDLPKSEKTKEKRLEVWFEIHCSEDSINKYINSLNDTKISSADKITIRYNSNTIKNDFDDAKHKLIKDIKHYNKRGAIINCKYDNIEE